MMLHEKYFYFRIQGSGLKKAFPVIQWLASQANELGGYKSTQVRQAD